jgi:rhodanese-related sulfurtransferase
MKLFDNLFSNKKSNKKTLYIKNLSSREFYESFNNSKLAVLLDVRTHEEYSQLRIPGSVLIDIHQPDFKDKISKLDNKKEYFVYCRRGIRSMNAATIMSEMGFENIVNLTGGIVNWEGPTESDI